MLSNVSGILTSGLVYKIPKGLICIYMFLFVTSQLFFRAKLKLYHPSKVECKPRQIQADTSQSSHLKENRRIVHNDDSKG